MDLISILSYYQQNVESMRLKMKIQPMLCAVGIHRYKTVDLTNCFYTVYRDTTWGPVHHMVYYLQCKCCGKRSFKSTYKQDAHGESHHGGIEYAKAGWVDHGVMYLGDGVTRRPGQAARGGKLSVVQGGKK